MESFAIQHARANIFYKTTKDLMYTNALATIDHETTKLAGVSSGNGIFPFIRGL